MIASLLETRRPCTYIEDDGSALRAVRELLRDAEWPPVPSSSRGVGRNRGLDGAIPFSLVRVPGGIGRVDRQGVPVAALRRLGRGQHRLGARVPQTAGCQVVRRLSHSAR